MEEWQRGHRKLAARLGWQLVDGQIRAWPGHPPRFGSDLEAAAFVRASAEECDICALALKILESIR